MRKSGCFMFQVMNCTRRHLETYNLVVKSEHKRKKVKSIGRGDTE